MFIEVDDQEYEKMRQDLSNALNELERVRVQLAGCAVAAQGYDLDLPKTAYGWSASYADVVALRKNFEIVMAEREKL